MLEKKLKIDWNKIDQVFLDMDGTLLDLHFDNHFWLDHLPQRYAEKNSLTKQEALNILLPKFKSMEGTIDWYCIDYWSKTLNLDIALLKEDVQHLIKIHPFVLDFLEQLKKQGKQRVLVTNAHQKSLSLKMKQTDLSQCLDTIISAHQLGIPKEDPNFWQTLSTVYKYQPKRTLLIDDNLQALTSAKEYGIEHLVAIYKPDSQLKIKDVAPFQAIHSFKELLF